MSGYYYLASGDRKPVGGQPSDRALAKRAERLRKPLDNTAAKELKHAVQVAMVYDDATGQLRACRLCEQARDWLGGECLNFASWKIREMDRIEVLPQAVQAATEADVILVSLAGERGLPIALCVWIDIWLPRRGGKPGALVAIFDNLSPLSRAYLEAVARRAGLDFFAHDGTSSRGLTDVFREQDLLKRTPGKTRAREWVPTD
jgi:hypothetical protein